MNRRQLNKGFVGSFKGGAEDSGSQEGTGNDISYAILKVARQSGQLNLSNRCLSSIPEKVWKINVDIPEEAKVASLADTDERWWDQVDLRKLIIASNKLTEIPDNLQYLPALTVLDAHDNCIDKVSDEIGNLRELTKLHLNHNKIKVFPKSLCNLSSMKVLLLASNEIENLHEDIGKLCNIEELSLMDNKLKTLPEGIGNMKLLKKLNLSKNEINKLPEGFEKLTQLRDLDLSSNNLEILPNGFGRLTSLEILECRYNQIKKFTTFTDKANIKQLFLGYNRIKEIDADVFDNLPNLVSLDLRDNAISSIPDSVQTLKLLERIDLSNNCLSGLPYVVGSMELKALTLDGNPLRGIRRDIVARGTQAILAYLRSRIPTSKENLCAPLDKKEQLDYNLKCGNGGTNNNGTTKVPSTSLDQNPVVRELTKGAVDEYLVATTKILKHSGGSNEIPNNVWIKGAKISSINFSKNSLVVFPGDIFDYAATLGELDLSSNKIQKIPPELDSLVKLTFLDLSSNMLSSVPDKISSLVHLIQITLSFNRFSEIPNNLFQLPKLQTILLANNIITEINVDGLLTMKCLITLDLSNNNIARIPPELGNVEWLRSLSLEGNAFRNPRPQIMMKGTQFILAYLRDRIPR